MIVTHIRASSAVSLIAGFLVSAFVATAQIPLIGREHAEIKRKRPADVHLANQTISVTAVPTAACAPQVAEQLKKVVSNGVIGANPRLREVQTAPQVQVECSITRCDYEEKTETKKTLYVKEKGKFKIITYLFEVSYKVVRVAGNHTYFADNVAVRYKEEFQNGVGAPSRSEVEHTLMSQVVRSILTRLSDTEEKHKVRLMDKDDLGRYSRLAQGGQWAQYIDSISSLAEKAPGKGGKSSFEADRHYNLSIAYEALAYETMWNDYDRAAQYFDLSDSYIRKAQQFDPREKEFVNAQTRMLRGKQYFETIKERFPRLAEAKVGTGAQPRGADQPPEPPPPTAGGMTNQDVIKLVKAMMSEEFVIDEIRRARVKQFDTTADGIVRLSSAGVSERIIKVMINSTTSVPTTKPPRKAPQRPR
ncbi:MAG: hypothetical protein WAU45_20460 [Blastocatellia bacterium]